MRKILAGFLATSMIVAVASSVTFAAASSAKITATLDDPADLTATSTSGDFNSTSDEIEGDWTAKLTVKKVTVTMTGTNDTFTIPINNEKTIHGTASLPASDGKVQYGGVVIDEADITGLIGEQTFNNADIGGALYSGKLIASGTGIAITFDEKAAFPNAITGATISIDAETSNVVSNAVVYEDKDKSDPAKRHEAEISAASGTVSISFLGSIGYSNGTGTETADVEKNGRFFDNYQIKDVVWCYGDGSPVPMTESPNGVDKDLNGENGSQSGTTLYFMINDTVDPKFGDDTYWKLKITKGDNAKLIKEVEDTTKIFNKTMYDAYNGKPITNIDFTKRHRFVKVKLNEIYTDDEYKCTLDLRLSPTSKAEDKYGDENIQIDDAEIKVKDFYFYVKNLVKTADNDWKVGIGGLMLNPLENDWNEVTYYDEDGDLAFMKFFADSDVDKFYAKLSTKWPHEDYAAYFNDQDAFLFQFTGSPKISATSRADLQIYNPFVDEDGNETVDPATAVVYQIVDGDLYDVTDQFEYKEGDNGDMAFCTRTRFLGTYVICEKAIAEAAGEDETVPEELTPDTNAGAPSEVPVDNGGGKQPANTGRYA